MTVRSMPSHLVSSRIHAIVAGLFCLLAAACGSDSALDPGVPPGSLQPASLSELFGTTLYRADQATEGLDSLAGKAVIAIYFGSHTCPACQGFVPRLLAVHREVRLAGGSFEVVYVSSDASAAAMFAAMADAGTPWPVLPWGGSKANGLVQRYEIRWIPSVVVIDAAGKTLSLKGRDEIELRGLRAYDDWLALSSTR